MVGAITPWNSPIASDAQKCAPALAAGNAVLLKPAAWTPLVSLAFGRVVHGVLAEAGLPTALLSVLPGSGREAGDAIVRDPRVGMVSFTGGTATGRGIAAVAAQKLMPVSLELGGKSPTVGVRRRRPRPRRRGHPLRDLLLVRAELRRRLADLPAARRATTRCSRRLAAATRALRVGPGTDPTTQVGPLVHHRHRDGVAAMVERAVAAGAHVVCGGAVPGRVALRRRRVLPADDPRPAPPRTVEICREEVFGPVAVVAPVRRRGRSRRAGRRHRLRPGRGHLDARPPPRLADRASPAAPGRCGSTPTSSSASPRRSAG